MGAAAYPSCDTAASHATTCQQPAKHPRLVLATTILASSLAFVDGSVVNVGLPAIGRSLSADAASLQWVVNAYLLPLSALLLLGGAAGDRFGRGRLLIGGTLLFAAASLGCALAPDLPVLIAARFVQGVGAALLMPNSLAILGAAFTGDAKGRAIGIWAASGAALGAVGPVLGGGLIDLGSWRDIFLLNLPLAAGAALLAWRFVPADGDRRDQVLDLPGGLLATLGLGVLTWSLTAGSGASGWTLGVLAAALVAVGVLILFVVVERRSGQKAMMPLALFASRPFVGLTLLTLFLYGALSAILVLVPYLLIRAAGYRGAAAGAALLPLPLVIAFASPWMGRLAARIGARAPLSLGSIVVAAGCLLALRVDVRADYWRQVLPAVLVLALGMSGAVAPLTTAVLNSVDDRHTGSASGFNSAVARIGGLVATALLGSVLAAQGEQLLSAFHAAMIAAAMAALAAAASAFALIAPGRSRPGPG